MKVHSLDHLVLTVFDIGKTADFYCNLLGMTKEVFRGSDGSKRTALIFGAQKINLHEAGHEFQPNAKYATPGSADLCLLSQDPIAKWTSHFTGNQIEIVDGPVRRTGATGGLISIYVRDPDGNLIEISNQAD